MTNIEKLKQAIIEGMNEVSFHEADSGGISLTIGHSISAEHSVSIFIPRDADMVFWGEADENQVNSFHLVP